MRPQPGGRPISHRSRVLAIPTTLAALAMTTRTEGHSTMTMTRITAPDAPVNQATPTDLATPEAASWAEMVEAMWASIQTTYFLPESGYYLERPAPGDGMVATLWPILGLLSGANARAIAGVSPDADQDFRSVFDLLGEYYDGVVDPPGYDSYPVAFGGGDKYYDDNQWLGIDGVYAYRHLGEQRYLDAAVLCWKLSLSGWSDDLGGGIYWKQFDHSTRNTCSNAPAAVLGMLLFEETGDQAYLDWSVRILEWTRQLKDPATGVYWDHITADGTIDEAKYTYNTGTPIHANALLHRATGDEAYLTEARSLAQAAFDWFAPATSATGTTNGVRVFPPNNAWFNSILFRGYVTLAEVDPEHDLTYVQAMLDFTRLGWARARDASGLLNPDWSGRQPAPEQPWLLDQAPVLEFASTAIRLGL